MIERIKVRVKEIDEDSIRFFVKTDFKPKIDSMEIVSSWNNILDSNTSDAEVLVADSTNYYEIEILAPFKESFYVEECVSHRLFDVFKNKFTELSKEESSSKLEIFASADLIFEYDNKIEKINCLVYIFNDDLHLEKDCED